MKRIAITFFIVVLFVLQIQAQDGQIWSLEKCINHAQKNSLSVRRAEVNVKQAQVSEKQNKMARYPTANGSLSHSYNFGRSVDPTSNDFVNQTIQSNGFSVSGGSNLYTGGRVKNSIKQSQIDIEASKADIEQARRNLALNIANAYLSILLAEEQVNTSELRLVQSQEQLDRTNKLIRAGSLPEGNRYDIEATIANEEQRVVSATNGVELAYLNLKLLMELDPATELKVESIENITMPTERGTVFKLNSIYTQAVAKQYDIKSSELRTKSAKLGIDIAKSGYLPTVSAFYNIGTNYSNIARRVDGFQTVQNDTEIQIGGMPTTITTFSDVPVFGKNPFFSQLNENLRGSVGISVNVPIFNGYQTKYSEERAQLAVQSAEFTTLQLKQNLKADIQRAIVAVTAAEKQYLASVKAKEANKISYENMEKRYNLGASTTFEYSTAKNNMDTAEFNLIIAKYDYIFKLKVLDFYQGKPITLN